MTRSRDVADTQDNIGGAVPPFAAGKNRIINGDFGINQRGFTSTTTSVAYIFDRFVTRADDGTSTFSAQTFTTGSAPVSGYEFKNFLQIQSTGQTLSTARTAFVQPIESVRTFAGQNATLSFWARATSGTPSVAAYVSQSFGSGGSPSAANDTNGQKVAITTSWARYSFTFSVPSIAGKTIGTDNNDAVRFFIFTSAGSFWDTSSASLGIQSTTIQFAGIQIEAGSVATPFQTATGTLQGELAACQRYYVRFAETTTNPLYGLGIPYSTTNAVIGIQLPSTMRVIPTSLDYSTLQLTDYVGAYGITNIALGGDTTRNYAAAVITGSGFTQYRPNFLRGNTSSSSFIGFSAEL